MAHVAWEGHEEERGGLSRMLDKVYGIHWTAVMLEKGRKLPYVDSTGNPVQIFSLLTPHGDVHSLPNVVEAILCRVDMQGGFGEKEYQVSWILVLSAHWSAPSVLSVCELLMEPPCMGPRDDRRFGQATHCTRRTEAVSSDPK